MGQSSDIRNVKLARVQQSLCISYSKTKISSCCHLCRNRLASILRRGKWQRSISRTHVCFSREWTKDTIFTWAPSRWYPRFSLLSRSSNAARERYIKLSDARVNMYVYVCRAFKRQTGTVVMIVTSEEKYRHGLDFIKILPASSTRCGSIFIPH